MAGSEAKNIDVGRHESPTVRHPLKRIIRFLGAVRHNSESLNGSQDSTPNHKTQSLANFLESVDSCIVMNEKRIETIIAIDPNYSQSYELNP